MEQKFIITSDDKTAQQLIAAGFQLVSEYSDMYVFLNMNSNFNFSKIKDGRYSFTNVLSI